MKFLKVFFSVILAIIAFVFSICFVSIESATKLLTKDNITNIIKDADYESMVSDDAMGEINDLLSESGLNITSEEIVNNEKVQEFVGGYISDALTSVLTGEEIKEVNENELSSLLKENLDNAVKEAEDNNVLVNQENIDALYSEIDNNIAEITDGFNEMRNELNNEIINNAELNGFSEGINIIKILYSIKYIFLIISLVSLLIIGLINMKEYKFVKAFAIIGVIFGIIYLFMGLSINTLTIVFNSSIEEASKAIITCINTIRNVILTTSCVYLVIGIILLILYKTVILNKIKNKINKEANVG